MNLFCETCNRADICLCDLPTDPIEAAVEILDAARALVRSEAPAGGSPTYAYDGPYLNANLRPCHIDRLAPYRRGNAPDGAYVYWADITGAPSWMSAGGWVSRVYRPLDIISHAIVRIAGADGAPHI